MGNDNGDIGTGTVTTIGDTGHRVYSNVRRFIVVRCKNLYCSCVYVIFPQKVSFYSHKQLC